MEAEAAMGVTTGAHKPRARDVGFRFGKLAPGPLNAITDVAGVAVGHYTLTRGEGALTPGRGPVRTGVTAIVPHGGNVFLDKPTAAVHVMNGFGKAAGFVQLKECGALETPILLTNTLSVGQVSDALIEYMLRANPSIGVETGTVNAVVGECNDGWLNDIRGRHVTKEHVFAALEGARSGPVAEGTVGAGTGMMAFGWKGGIGTASRLIPLREEERCRDRATAATDASGDGTDGATGMSRGGDPLPSAYTLGALVLSNFGAASDLTVDGWPVGRFLPAPDTSRSMDGSIVTVLATDAPLDARQLGRVAARAVVGLVRTGSRLAHGSGDYVIAFSTARRVPHTFSSSRSQGAAAKGPSILARPRVSVLLPDDGAIMAGLLRAAGEATEEAIINSLFQATTVVGRDGHVGRELPVEAVLRLVEGFRGG